MSSPLLVRSALALALSRRPAHAATDADLAEIREEIRQLKESYEARIQALEQRLKEAEARPPSASTPRPPLPLPRRSPQRAGSPGRGCALRRRRQPASARSTRRSRRCCRASTPTSQDPNKYAIDGFVPSGDIAPGEARLQHRRVGARALRQRRRQDLRQPDLLARARQHGRGRGSLRRRSPRCRTASRRSSDASCPASATSTTSTSTLGFLRRAALYQAFLGGQFRATACS